MDQKKIIIHFVPGSYGHFLKGLLCKSLKMPNNNISDFHWISNTDIIDTSHDLEKESKNFIFLIICNLSTICSSNLFIVN